MKCIDIGPPDASIVLVGEAPGQHEERSGVPFSGPAGNLLKHMLAHAGIDFNECFVTNVMNVRPPNNDFKYFYEGALPKQTLLDAQQLLRNKIEGIRPKVVITLGSEPLKALCGKSSVTAYRGTWLSFRGINVMPTFHPSYVLRVFDAHPIVEHDLLKAVSQRPTNWPPCIVEPSLGDVLRWLDGCQKRVAFDIETIERSIRCIGFADSRGGISIPFMRFASSDLTNPLGSKIVKLPSASCSDSPSSYWSAEDEVRIIDAIQRLLQSGIEVVGHNSISFDAPFILREYGLTIKNHYLDTMHAWHTLYSEFPNGLDFVSSMLTNYPNYWTGKDGKNDLSEWLYNARDCIVTYDISHIIEQELKETVVTGSHLYV